MTPPLPPPKVRILIGEDVAEIAFLMSQALEQAGYVVMVAADGEECLRLARETLPDLITLDSIMRKMHGFDVLRALFRSAFACRCAASAAFSRWDAVPASVSAAARSVRSFHSVSSWAEVERARIGTAVIENSRREGAQIATLWALFPTGNKDYRRAVAASSLSQCPRRYAAAGLPHSGARRGLRTSRRRARRTLIVFDQGLSLARDRRDRTTSLRV